MNNTMRKHILYSLALAVPVAMLGVTPVHALNSRVGLSANANTQVTLQDSRVNSRIEVRQNNVVNARKVATEIFNNRFIKVLSDIRARVSSSTTLSAEAKAELLGRLDAEINWFTQERGNIQAATTVSAVKSITANARTRFLVDAKELRKLYVNKGYVVSLQRVIDNLNKNVVTKLETKLNKLSDAGVNVSSQTALLVTAKSDIATAQANVNVVQSSSTLVEARKSFKAARAALQHAKQTLKQALTSLRDMLPKEATVKGSASAGAVVDAH